MPLNWMDMQAVPINVLLLLEREQIGWLPGWLNEEALGRVFKAHPHIAWYFAHKNPDVKSWVNKVQESAAPESDPQKVYQAEQQILNSMQDLVIYAWNPQVYDALDFLNWPASEVTDLVDFKGKTVVDIGSGTGKQVAIALEAGAKDVIAVEPVANLRYYMTEKFMKQGYHNLHCIDGIITDIPLPDAIADIVMEGHVVGDVPEQELAEMERITKPGGMLIHAPGNNDKDNEIHQAYLERGYQWSRFEEPGDGTKRKYWKVK